MGKTIFAIDPGATESAYAILDTTNPIDIGKIKNEDLLEHIRKGMHEGFLWDTYFAIEQIRSFGFRVGNEIFDTVHFSGKLDEAANGAFMIPRKTIAAHICGTATAGDSKILNALVNRFAKGAPNKGKGTKDNPGFFYGFHDDIWQAYAVGVTYWDTRISKL
jgi:hypothetical protein